MEWWIALVVVLAVVWLLGRRAGECRGAECDPRLCGGSRLERGTSTAHSRAGNHKGESNDA